jgi:hypothetical protein
MTTTAKPIDTLDVSYRGLNDDTDLNFVYDSWIRSYKVKLSPNSFNDEEREYKAKMRKRIDDLISRGAMFQVACDPEEPSTIFGWCCFTVIGDVPVLHYVYVKKPFRGQHIVRRLLEGLKPKMASHSTRLGERSIHDIEYIGGE